MHCTADFKENYSILIFTKQSQIAMINATKSLEICIRLHGKTLISDGRIGAAFSSLYEAGGTIKSAV